MWKPILIVAAIVIGILIAAGISWFMVNPDGLVDTMMGLDDDFHVRIDDKPHEIIFTRYRDDASPQDRVWLMKKWVLLRVMSRKDATLAPKREEFARSLLEAAGDNTLDGSEMKRLRAMHEEIVTPEMMKHWVKTLRQNRPRDPDDN